MFGFLGGRKRQPVVVVARNKGGRPKGSRDKTPRKRRSAWQIEQDRFLHELKESDPDLYRRTMLERIGLADGNGDQDGDEIDHALALLGKLEKLDKLRGRKGAEDRGGSDNFLLRVLDTQFGAQLGTMLAPTIQHAMPMLQAAAAHQANGAPNGHTPSAPAQSQNQASTPAQQQAPSDSEKKVYTPDDFRRHLTSEQRAEGDETAQRFIKALGDKSPEDAAAALVQFSTMDAQVKALVADLARIEATPEAVFDFVAAQLKQSPVLAPLWFWVGDRAQWSAAVVASLKTRVRVAPPQPAEGI